MTTQARALEKTGHPEWPPGSIVHRSVSAVRHYFHGHTGASVLRCFASGLQGRLGAGLDRPSLGDAVRSARRRADLMAFSGSARQQTAKRIKTAKGLFQPLVIAGGRGVEGALGPLVLLQPQHLLPASVFFLLAHPSAPPLSSPAASAPPRDVRNSTQERIRCQQRPSANSSSSSSSSRAAFTWATSTTLFSPRHIQRVPASTCAESQALVSCLVKGTIGHGRLT